MNETEIQPQPTQKKETLSKLTQYAGTAIGSVALVTAGALSLSNPDKAPQEQNKIINVDNTPAPQAELPGVVLTDKPQPRREVATVPEPAASGENETDNTNQVTEPSPLSNKDTDKDFRDQSDKDRPNLGNDVVIMNPAAEQSQTSSSDTIETEDGTVVINEPPTGEQVILNEPPVPGKQ